MGLSLEELHVYPIAGATANTIWGCLITPRIGAESEKGIGGGQSWPPDIGSNVYCQCIQGKLFLPENSRLYPQLSVAGLEKLLKDRQHLFHPETGWIELPEPIRWEDLLRLPAATKRTIIRPEEPVFIPSRALAFYKQSLPSEEVLENMEQELFPERAKNTKPLTPWEKIKLGMLRTLFGNPQSPGAGKKPGWFSRLMPKLRFKWLEKLQDNLDDLEERNNREVDKLLDLFKKNPREALKYAIPIDNEGVSRGKETGSYMLSRWWASFNALGDLVGNGKGSGYGGTVRLGSKQVNLLNQEYRNTAQDLMKNKEYRQAAYIYLRLLKDHYSGADALEKAGLHAEAASVYLKYANNKLRAAECYEKGKMPLEAIELYKELQHIEKVGDLYLSIGKQKEARPFFEEAIDTYAGNQQYVKAAVILRDKLFEPARAQTLLLQGWKDDKDAVNCLNFYFSIIDDTRRLEREIQVMYDRETSEKNREKYLQVLKHQFDRYTEIQDTTRDIAYEIIAQKIGSDPFIAAELQSFNKKDKRLLKDILIYRQRKK
jgi:hypothetical protein